MKHTPTLSSQIKKKVQSDKGWWKNTAGQEHREWGRYAVTNEIPVCLSVDINWTLL
jgi:hypothetical protein